MNNSIFYVYQYLDDTGNPYYIGKGSNDRINESHAPWIELPPRDLREFVKTGMNEKDAFDFELELIKKYGRKIDGGILDNKKLSRWVAQSGWKHTEETKQTISKKNQGKTRTDEQKQNYRKPKSAEHVEKIRQANLGRINDGRSKKAAETVAHKLTTNKEYAEKFWAIKKQQSDERTGKPWSEARRLAQKNKIKVN